MGAPLKDIQKVPSFFAVNPSSALSSAVHNGLESLHSPVHSVLPPVKTNFLSALRTQIEDKAKLMGSIVTDMDSEA